MISRALVRVLAGFFCLVAGGEAAWSQSAQCQNLRAELASLGRGRARSDGGAQIEAARLSGYYRSIGCERTGFFIFGGPPAECGAIAARINALRASAGSSRGDGSVEIRRRQLAAAINRTCSAQGNEPGRSPTRRATDDGPGSGSRTGGARRTVCVRTCDGFFFPMSSAPRQGSADEMCRALCPGAETAAFHMPGEDLARAVSTKGRPYTQLANAFRFQKSLDASCSCKKPQESWAQVLQRAELMLGRVANDVIVTARRSEELSRPKGVRSASVTRAAASAGGLERGGAVQDAAMREPRVTITFGSDAPAGSGEPEPNPAEVPQPVVSLGEIGRTVRVVSPDILPPPQTRMQ